VRYFIDTEFSERGHAHPIELISIGIASEDGTQFYAVASDGWSEERCNDWVKANVLPNLADRTGNIPWLSRAEIAQAIRNYVSTSIAKPEFWGYYADYDWVVFCQLFGAMVDLPKGWPMYCNDLKQLCMALGDPLLPSIDGHNALEDALHARGVYRYLQTLAHR
jgi:hypothetical protein